MPDTFHPQSERVRQAAKVGVSSTSKQMGGLRIVSGRKGASGVGSAVLCAFHFASPIIIMGTIFTNNVQDEPPETPKYNYTSKVE